MRSTLITTCAILAVNGFTASYAATSQDAAYDKNEGTVRDNRGECVRTKWQDANDPCAPPAPPAPPPEPIPVVKPAPTPQVSQEQRTVYFAFNSAVLTAEAQAKLDALATIVNASSAVSDVRIHGYTDQFGTDSYNKALADKRAASVKAYLDGRSRLQSTVAEVLGLGKSAPDAQCAAVKKRAARIDCMSQQRRVEVELKVQN